jgi:hypothetical protein
MFHDHHDRRVLVFFNHDLALSELHRLQVLGERVEVFGKPLTHKRNLSQELVHLSVLELNRPVQDLDVG